MQTRVPSCQTRIIALCLSLFSLFHVMYIVFFTPSLLYLINILNIQSKKERESGECVDKRSILVFLPIRFLISLCRYQFYHFSLVSFLSHINCVMLQVFLNTLLKMQFINPVIVNQLHIKLWRMFPQMGKVFSTISLGYDEDSG